MTASCDHPHSRPVMVVVIVVVTAGVWRAERESGRSICECEFLKYCKEHVSKCQTTSLRLLLSGQPHAPTQHPHSTPRYSSPRILQQSHSYLQLLSASVLPIGAAATAASTGATTATDINQSPDDILGVLEALGNVASPRV
jgi:hypothetical protein